MEFTEINVPESIVQQINHVRPYAGIMVDTGNADIVYPNVKIDVSYEDSLDEINMERARYLLSTDEINERWHSSKQI